MPAGRKGKGSSSKSGAAAALPPLADGLEEDKELDVSCTEEADSPPHGEWTSCLLFFKKK